MHINNSLPVANYLDISAELIHDTIRGHWADIVVKVDKYLDAKPFPFSKINLLERVVGLCGQFQPYGRPE